MIEFKVKDRLLTVLQQLNDAYSRRPKAIVAPKPLLVAVSKTKSVDAIIDAYSIGQRDFGENYVQELIQKSHHPDILIKCPDIKWHFIGHLQNNKADKIVRVPNIYMIQSVDSEKLAEKLNFIWEKVNTTNKQPLKVLIQINTSGEIEKSGVNPNKAPELFKYIFNNMKNLKIDGIMTIGTFGHDYSGGLNPDFVELMRIHRTLCEQNQLASDSLHVSMGMSNDFEKAVEMGSTIVRVGSSIFGERTRNDI